MHTTTTVYAGRLCNQIIRNIAVSIVAKKHDLFVEYCNYELISDEFGIPLFIGTNKYDNVSNLTDDNFFEILNKDSIETNLYPMDNYFQTKDISSLIYQYLQTIQTTIINKNKYKDRYNDNNDIFIHIRLGDVVCYSPGFEYYIEALHAIDTKEGSTIYIGSDTLSHPMINDLRTKYNNIELIDMGPTETIQFGSTCKHVILSHGSFSAFIGWISFFSDVYYPDYSRNVKWCGDMFSIDKWHKI